MTWSQIDQTGTVWRFHQAKHKSDLLGHQSTIAIGPEGQEILSWYLSKKFQPTFLFSPKDSTLEINPASRATFGCLIYSPRGKLLRRKGTAKAHQKPQKPMNVKEKTN